MLISAGEKIYLRGRGSGWVGNFAIFVGVSEGGVNENFAGKGISLVRGDGKCSDPEAGVCLEYSRIVTKTVWLEQSKGESGNQGWRGEGREATTWGWWGRTSRVIRRTLAFTLIEMQNQWRVNALDDITPSFPCSSQIFQMY